MHESTRNAEATAANAAAAAAAAAVGSSSNSASSANTGTDENNNSRARSDSSSSSSSSTSNLEPTLGTSRDRSNSSSGGVTQTTNTNTHISAENTARHGTSDADTQGGAFLLSEYCPDFPFSDTRLKELKVLIKTLIRGMPSLLTHMQVLQLKLKNALFGTTSSKSAAATATGSATGSASASVTTTDPARVAATETYTQISTELHSLQAEYFKRALQCCAIFTVPVHTTAPNAYATVTAGDAAMSDDAAGSDSGNGSSSSSSGAAAALDSNAAFNAELKSTIDYFISGWASSSKAPNVTLNSFRTQIFREILSQHIEFIYDLRYVCCVLSAMYPCTCIVLFYHPKLTHLYSYLDPLFPYP